MEETKNRFTSNKEREEYLDSQLNELAEHQEAELLLDFDKAIEEHEKQNIPYKIKFNNKFHFVPREMPFDFATFFFRYCYKKVNGKIKMDVPEEKMMRFIELMFGKDMLRALESGKKRVDMLFVFEKLSMKILDKWGYGLEDKVDESGKPKKNIMETIVQKKY